MSLKLETYDKLNEQLAPWPPSRVQAYGSCSIAICYFCPPLCHQRYTLLTKGASGEQASGKV